MKVAIVGGSVAGLNAACELAQNSDAEITLYEEHPEIGKPVQCAEGYIDLGAGRPPLEVIDTIVRRAIIKMSNGGDSKEFSISFPGGIFWIIDRQKYERGLAKKCEGLGVEIFTGKKASVRELRDKNDYVIDASGYPSQTSKEYHFEHEYKNIGRTIQYTLEGDFTSYCDKKREASVLLRFDKSHLGYYWLFPKSQNRANVGIGWFDGYPNISELEKIIELENIEGDIVRRSGGCIPCQPLPVFIYDNVLLVGDAAGLVVPFWGEGIENAIISAHIASRCIIEENVQNYRREVMKLIGRKIEMGNRLKDMWYMLDFKTFGDFFSIAGDVPFDSLDNPLYMGVEMLKRPILMSKIGLCVLKNKLGNG